MVMWKCHDETVTKRKVWNGLRQCSPSSQPWLAIPLVNVVANRPRHGSRTVLRLHLRSGAGWPIILTPRRQTTEVTTRMRRCWRIGVGSLGRLARNETMATGQAIGDKLDEKNAEEVI